jgi:hypothetical protein
MNRNDIGARLARGAIRQLAHQKGFHPAREVLYSDSFAVLFGVALVVLVAALIGSAS